MSFDYLLEDNEVSKQLLRRKQFVSTVIYE